MTRLPRGFFARPAPEVAPELLGSRLVRALPEGVRLSGTIVEAEAYEPGDPASHAFRGRTPRNAVMFGAPGHLYVYFTYGNHWMANIVTRGRGEGSAVLIRALRPLDGVDEMRVRRGRERLHDLCSGPGKLCQALAIDRNLDGSDLVRGREVWLERGVAVEPDSITTGSRVGVSVGLDRPWRFSIAGDPFVSRGRPGPPTRRRRSAPSTPRS
jgi:DNA-3-methyladenine glycosylase